MDNSFSIYWICLDSHDDPFSEGYIGMTKYDPKIRLRQHAKYGPNPYVKEGISNGASLRILHRELTEEEAKKLEKRYRPSKRIGWNIAPGGKRTSYNQIRSIKMIETKRLRNNLGNGTLGYRWFTDGLNIIRLRSGETPPEGFYPGRTPRIEKPKEDFKNKILECPHCHRTGKFHGMLRWHFDNCHLVKPRQSRTRSTT